MLFIKNFKNLVLIVFMFMFVSLPSFAQADAKHDTQLMDSILAPGFHWNICPDDLGGAIKERLYKADASRNVWWYVYDQAPQYIFNNNFYDLLSSSDQARVMFCFENNRFISVEIEIRTSNYDALSQAYNNFLLKNLGQPNYSNNELRWNKDNYVLLYSGHKDYFSDGRPIIPSFIRLHLYNQKAVYEEDKKNISTQVPPKTG
jgi:hypothetical protein